MRPYCATTSAEGDDESFFREMLGFFRENRRAVVRRLRLRGNPELVLDMFCRGLDGSLKHLYICRLGLVLSGVLGRALTDHLNARMLLGPKNQWVEGYIRHVDCLRPNILWFNPNPNPFRNHTLGFSGNLVRLALK